MGNVLRHPASAGEEEEPEADPEAVENAAQNVHVPANGVSKSM